MTFKHMLAYDLSNDEQDLVSARVFELSDLATSIHENTMFLNDTSYLNTYQDRFTPKDNIPPCVNCGAKIYLDENYSQYSDDTYICAECKYNIEADYDELADV